MKTLRRFNCFTELSNVLLKKILNHQLQCFCESEDAKHGPCVRGACANQKAPGAGYFLRPGGDGGSGQHQSRVGPGRGEILVDPKNWGKRKLLRRFPMLCFQKREDVCFGNIGNTVWIESHFRRWVKTACLALKS